MSGGRVTTPPSDVMWSAGYPIQAFERCIREAHELPLRDGVLRRYMRDNALAVFKLG